MLTFHEYLLRKHLSVESGYPACTPTKGVKIRSAVSDSVSSKSIRRIPLRLTDIWRSTVKPFQSQADIYVSFFISQVEPSLHSHF